MLTTTLLLGLILGSPSLLADLPGYVTETHGDWRWASPGGKAPPSPRMIQFIDDSLVRIRRRLAAREPAGVLIVYTAERRGFVSVVTKLGGREPPSFTAAIAFPARGIVVLDGEKMHFEPIGGYTETVGHELAHLVLGAGGAAVPRWYHEGVAQWLSGAHLDWESRNILAYLARGDGLVPFSEMDVFPRTHRISSVYYRQSLGFVNHLAVRHGEDVHARILERLRAGDTMSVAFETVVKEPLTEVESRWIRALGQQFSWTRAALQSLGLFHILAVVVIIGFVSQFVRRRRRLRQMAAEEKAIYGEELPEERSH